MTKHRTALAALIGGMALAACQPTDYSQPSNARTGAAAGALIGGALGATSGGDDRLAKGALGAIIGAGVGGLIGSQLDAQARELDAQIVNDRVRIINEGNQLRVVMPEGILFATDSATVNPAIQNDLYTVANSLNRYGNTRVEVIGHADNTGSAPYNQGLSERRAGAVAAVLRAGGVSGGRISAYGLGLNQPIASNATAEGRAQNRRVEILIIPVQ
jgi:outer membrane protein OmpA-like peptidoglycan-associated protein